MLRVSDVDVSKQKVYFSLKIDTVSEVQSLTLGDDIFDSNVARRVDDEFMNGSFACCLIAPPREGVRSIVTSMSVCLSVCLLAELAELATTRQNFTKFLCVLPRGRGCVAICYVLPVLWMASCFRVMALWRVMCIGKRRCNEIPTKFAQRKRAANTHRELCTWGRSLLPAIPLLPAALAIDHGRQIYVVKSSDSCRAIFKLILSTSRWCRECYRCRG